MTLLFDSVLRDLELLVCETWVRTQLLQPHRELKWSLPFHGLYVFAKSATRLLDWP